MTKVPTFAIYTDGACNPNPGIGACAFVAFLGDAVDPFTEKVHAYELTTSSRMEMMAALSAMQHLPPSVLRIFSDSSYLVKGMNEWVNSWAKRGWVKLAGDPVKNVDLWKALMEERNRHIRVSFTWIRGHNGHVWNERCNTLAETAVRETADEDLLVDVGYAPPREMEDEAPQFCPCGYPAEDGRQYCGFHSMGWQDGS